MSYIDDALNAEIRFEQLTTWLYLDSKGLPTTAVGEMVPDTATLCGFPWHTADGGLASLAQIRAEYARVKAMPVGCLASYYRSAHSLLLPEDWCRARLALRIEAHEQDLRRLFNGYDKLPDALKVALIDMEHNLGPGRTVPKPTGIREYVHMIAAINAGDFVKAAALCDRDTDCKAFAGRNEWTRQQMLSAAKAGMVVSPAQGAAA